MGNLGMRENDFSKVVLCPYCEGRGWIRKVRVKKDDPDYMPDVYITLCDRCQGKGALWVSEEEAKILGRC